MSDLKKRRLPGGRKFTIALLAMVFEFVAMGLSFYLALQGKDPVITGGHLVTGLGLIVGLYGGSNVLAKLKKSQGE